MHERSDSVTGTARPGQAGLAPAIRPSLAAFESWLEGARHEHGADPADPAGVDRRREGVEVVGRTVRDVVSGLVTTYPGLEAQLLGQDGELNSFVNVFLNDTDIRHLDGSRRPSTERDTLVLLPAMAGG